MVKRFTRHKLRPVATGNDDSNDNHYVEQKSQCQECQRKNVKATYRPLVNDNGAFLCDECYTNLYPATAMYDADENMFSKINQKIREKRANTKYPEEEECHACLEHGSYRRCCKHYYCRSCYYESGACPGCETPSHRSGVTQNQQRPSKMAVLATWGISVSVLLILVGFVSATIVNSSTKPRTVWGHTCYGWFPQCGKPVCVDFNSSDPSSGMPTEYELCTVNETDNKVTGDACIFDPELYRWSDKLLGFDLCIEGDQNKLSTIRQGAYIFEDNFDYWANGTNYKPDSVMMKSAKWENVQNAKASDICGMNSISRAYELEHGDFVTSRKNASLVFSGVNHRYAETQDLDVRFGGNVEFYLKLAPVVSNELATECKTAFVGDVALSYSIDNGLSWQSMRNYPVWKYRNEYFQLVKEDIPEAASTEATRFRWSQSVFDPKRDYWAIDDVRIFGHIEPSFYGGDLYRAKISQRKKSVHQQQCHFDTEQCTEFPNDKRSRNHFRLRAVDIYITVCVVILVSRKAFQELHKWSNAQKSSPKKENDADKLSIPMKKKFNYKVSKSWQIFALSLLMLPLLSLSIYMTWHVVHWWSFYSKDTLSTLYICLSFAMDFWALRTLSLDILHFWPFYVEHHVEIDATNEVELLIVGTEEIPLLDIPHISLFSKELYWAFFCSVCVSGFPFSSAMVFIRAMKMRYQNYVMLLHILGTSSLFRTLLGPAWFVEFFLSIKAICSLSGKDRDDLGRAFARPSLAHATANSTISALLVLGPYLFYAFRKELNTLYVIVIIFATIFIGVLAGSLVGLLRGLPIVPRIHLTTWPNDGYQFTHNRKSKPVHFFASLLSGGMNSCELYVMNISDMELFRLLLSGKVGAGVLLSKKIQSDKSITNTK